MKTVCLIFLFFAQTALYGAMQQLPAVRNTAFQPGEIMKFKLYYTSALTGHVNAGEMVSKIAKNEIVVRGDTTWHIQVTGKTLGAFRWFYKVNDHYETYLDKTALVPRFFHKDIKENDYTEKRKIDFYHEQSTATTVNLENMDIRTVHIQPHVQDLISSIYFARTFDADTLKINDYLIISYLMGDSVYTSKLKFIGRDTIETSLGKIKCLKFNPSVLTGGVFKDNDKLVVYISDDLNHLPVLAESEILIGSVRAELIECENLRNPFTSRIHR